MSPHSAAIPAARNFGQLLRDSLSLWLTGIRALFPSAMVLALLSQLPLVIWWLRCRHLFEGEPLLAWANPAWLQIDATSLLTGLVSLAAALPVLLHLLARQAASLRGHPPHGPGSSWRATLQLLPAACVATITYLALCLATLLPVAAGWWVGASAAEPLVLPAALLIGLLVSAVPLAWVSIAAVFIYPPIILDGLGGLAAQVRSFRLVRGSWLLCAALLSMVTVIQIGLASALGTLPLLMSAALSLASGGPGALLRPGWVVLGQLLATPAMALTLPLLSAAYLVCHEELERRRQAGPA